MYPCYGNEYSHFRSDSSCAGGMEFMKKIFFIISIMMILLMAGCSNKQGTTIQEEKITTETSGREVEKDEKVTAEKTTEENIMEEKTTDLESTETSIAVDGNNYFETYEEAYEAVLKQNYSDEDVSLQLDLGFEYPVLCVGQRDYYCEFWYYNKETKMYMKATERLEEGTWGRMTEYIPGLNYLIQQGYSEDDEGNPSTWQEVYEVSINDESGQLELNYIEKKFDSDAEMKSIWESTN